MKKTVEIIVHCWAGIHADYAALLRMQLASICCGKWQKVKPFVTIAYVDDGSDEPTKRVITDFAELMPLRLAPLRRPLIFKRHLGRDVLAKQSTGDIVWFADCDYLFGAGSLDALVSLLDMPPRIFYPQTSYILKSHTLGDAILRGNDKSLPSLEHFELLANRRAIGGIQIVHGETARKYGYPVKKRHQGEGGAERFKVTFGDSAYRRELKALGIRPMKVEVPNVFRMRHTCCGYAVDGEHKDAI